MDKGFSSRHQLSYVDNYKKWITTICVRTFYDFYRKKKRWKDRVLDLFHKEDGGEIDFADDVNISEEFIRIQYSQGLYKISNDLVTIIPNRPP